MREKFENIFKSGLLTPARMIIGSFLCLIVLGTLLLMLPFSTQEWGGAGFLDALFTATSASCVTGLVVQDTATYWSGFGQLVILLLIQTGGLGVVTVAVAIFRFSGKRIGLKQRWIMQEAIAAPQVGGIVRVTGFILKGVFLIEGLGALILAFRFCPRFGFFKGIWYAIFHSISAFCNAGFDLMGVEAPFSSLTGWEGDGVVNVAIMLLIIIGGLGFLTWQDVVEHKWRLKSYRLQSKLVLVTTGVLLALGFLFFYLYEFRLSQWEGLSGGEKLLGAMFQSVSPRTAGFNTVDLNNMSPPSQLLTILLMLVGGSTGSTAGGFKTTTLAVLVLSAVAVFRKRRSAQCFGRRLQDGVLHNACAIFVLYLGLFLVGGIFLACVDQVPLMPALFEAGSALATVGLSLAGTTTFSAPCRLVLIFLMYFGRVGGLTLIFALTANNNTNSQFPQELVTVG